MAPRCRCCSGCAPAAAANGPRLLLSDVHWADDRDWSAVRTHIRRHACRFPLPASCSRRFSTTFRLRCGPSRRALPRSTAGSSKRRAAWAHPAPRTFATVVLPLSWPAVLAGLVLAFAHTVGEFGVVLDGGRQHPRRDADHRARNLRRRAGAGLRSGQRGVRAAADLRGRRAGADVLAAAAVLPL